MNNFSKRLAGLSLGLLLTLGVGVAGGQHDVVGAKAADATTSTLIIDGSQLTGTATTVESTYFYDNTAIVMSKGAKQYSVKSDAKNNISTNPTIFIGQKDTYIYNKTPIGNKITKFEVYANSGASSTVTVGINFSNTPISAYDAEASNTYTGTLSTLDNVYDISDKLSSNAQYFWYQVTNNKNSQVQFRITYESDDLTPTVDFDIPSSISLGATGTLTATTNPADGIVKWEVLEDDYLSIDENGSYKALKGGKVNVVAWLYAATDTETKTPLACCKKTTLVEYVYGGEGTKEKPYTVSDAYYIASLLETGKNNGEVVYVKGKISSDVSVNTEYNSATFNITDESSTIIAYSINGASNVFKGSTVVATGVIINYNGTLEFGYARGFAASLDSCVGDAKAYVEHFASSLEDVCADSSKDNIEALTSVWANLKAAWEYVDSASKETLKTATAEDADYGEFVNLYDHIMKRYGEDKLGTGANFVGRTISSTTSGAHVTLASADNSLTITIIVLVSVLSVSLIVGTSLIVRKRKAN